MSLFHRLATDGTRTDIALENTFAGATPSACWLIGGGPSLARLPVHVIRDSPAPKMCVNLAGARLLRPTFWTSYDPTARFHRSVYLDPGVMKFVHRRRSMDLVPDTTLKVCDCPNLYFFDRDPRRGFADFLSPAHTGIVDWADSLVQAIDILYRLGFRTLYLAGCEMHVRPSAAQRTRAALAGVTYRPRELLRDFVHRCEAAGLTLDDLEAAGPAPQYHFDEHKPLRAAASTDLHYFRTAQALRLARRSITLAGLQIVSCTPHSRLNDYFPYVPVRRAAARLRRDIGDPRREPVRGLYGAAQPRLPRGLGPMRDDPPPHARASECAVTPSTPVDEGLYAEAEYFEPVLLRGSGLPACRPVHNYAIGLAEPAGPFAPQFLEKRDSSPDDKDRLPWTRRPSARATI